jgi:hypothetical protein
LEETTFCHLPDRKPTRKRKRLDTITDDTVPQDLACLSVKEEQEDELEGCIRVQAEESVGLDEPITSHDSHEQKVLRIDESECRRSQATNSHLFSLLRRYR